MEVYSSGAQLIAEERIRQVLQEGFDWEHDAEKHNMGELLAAGNSYLVAADDALNGRPLHQPLSWPWEESWWKPKDDPIRNLVKAGALIAAEIDRLQRLEEVEDAS